MQEDIKILKELTEEYNSQHYMDMPLINGKQIQALENLLKGYRELEEKYINPSKARISYYDTKKRVEVVIEGFIPKSKIKEKIEELEKKILEYEAYRERGKETDVEYYDFIANSARKKVLQELLEDK